MLAGPLGGCTVGPDYTAAAAPTPTKFKELAGWKVATPSDGPGRGEWWTLYRDAKLDFLIKQIGISNQTVAADAAAYEQARALIREAQAGLFPVLTGTYQGTRTRTGVGALGTNGAFGPGIVGTSSDGGVYSTNIEPQLAASWDLDVWGKVRRQIRRFSVNRFVELVSTTPAKLFGLYPRKGTIAVGSDADLVVFDPKRQHTISAKTHHMRVDYSMFEGVQVTGMPEVVLSRGRIVVDQGKFLGRAGQGEFLRRSTYSQMNG